MVKMTEDNELAIILYEEYMQICTTTIEEAKARIVVNTEELAKIDSLIAETEAFKAVREGDLAVANEDMVVETARWDHETMIHEDLMAEL